MNFSALFSFPGSLILFYGAGSLLFIVGGLLMNRNGHASAKRPLKETTRAILLRQAQRWHVPEAALADLHCSLIRCSSAFAVGAGFCALLFTMIYTLLLMSPAWSLVCPFSIGSFVNSVWLLACMIGGSAGGFSTFHHLRGEARAMRDGGARRCLRDYRSSLFYLIPGVWFILLCGPVFLFHRFSMPINGCLSDNFPVLRPGIIRPWQMWVIFPWMGFAFLALLSMELLLARIASASSPLVPTSVADVEAIDDLFRARIMHLTQYLALVQIVFFTEAFSTVVSAPYNLITYSLPFLSLLPGMLLLISSSGLGGKLTGWFWK